MSREKECFRDNLEVVRETFGNLQFIPIKKAAELIGIDPRTLMKDRTFPLKQVGRMYYVPAVGLARWMS